MLIGFWFHGCIRFFVATLTGRGWGREEEEEKGEGAMTREAEVRAGQARRGTMLMAGSFVATMRLLADIFYPRETMFAHRRV